MNVKENHDLSVQEVASLLHYHPETIRRLIRTKRISAYRLNGRYRISQSEIDSLRNNSTKEVN